MANTNWIKLATDIPDHRKIKRIRKMPDGNNIILFWVFLLARAGESNHSGGLYMTDTLPYDTYDLAADFDFTSEFVELALLTLEKYGMVTCYDEIIFIKNWEEYQSVDSLDKIREQNRIRQERYREKQKVIALGNVTDNVTSNGEVTQCNAIDIELELDKEIDIDKEIKESSTPHSSDSEIKQKSKKKIIKHKYGSYSNVLLSDEQLDKLKNEFPNDWEARIEKVSEYCASTGKPYKDYLATIRSWARRDKAKGFSNSKYGKAQPKTEKLPDWAKDNPVEQQQEIQPLSEERKQKLTDMLKQIEDG